MIYLNMLSEEMWKIDFRFKKITIKYSRPPKKNLNLSLMKTILLIQKYDKKKKRNWIFVQLSAVQNISGDFDKTVIFTELECIPVT